MTRTSTFNFNRACIYGRLRHIPVAQLWRAIAALGFTNYHSEFKTTWRDLEVLHMPGAISSSANPIVLSSSDSSDVDCVGQRRGAKPTVPPKREATTPSVSGVKGVRLMPVRLFFIPAAIMISICRTAKMILSIFLTMKAIRAQRFRVVQGLPALLHR